MRVVEPKFCVSTLRFSTGLFFIGKTAFQEYGQKWSQCQISTQALCLDTKKPHRLAAMERF